MNLIPIHYHVDDKENVLYYYEENPKDALRNFKTQHEELLEKEIYSITDEDYAFMRNDEKDRHNHPEAEEAFFLQIKIDSTTHSYGSNDICYLFEIILSFIEKNQITPSEYFKNILQGNDTTKEMIAYLLDVFNNETEYAFLEEIQALLDNVFAFCCEYYYA